MKSSQSTEYHFITPQIDDQLAQVSFTGSFKGQPVTWIADILTIQHYYSKYPEAVTTPENARQFIEIRTGDRANQYKLIIGLASPKIDHPTILKSIIMIRNYKRLGMGRHEFGEPAFISKDS